MDVDIHEEVVGVTSDKHFYNITFTVWRSSA